MFIKSISLNHKVNMFISFLLCFISFCSQSYEMRKVKVENNNKSLFMELSNNDSIILSWDNPVDTTGAVKYNELFYHSSKDIHWTLLQSKIPYENNPKVVVHKNDIAPQDSLLYFGVRYVSNDTTYSDLHSSADSNAYPPKGWFLQWIK